MRWHAHLDTPAGRPHTQFFEAEAHREGHHVTIDHRTARIGLGTRPRPGVHRRETGGRVDTATTAYGDLHFPRLHDPAAFAARSPILSL
jgi:hypothetical protein